MSVPALCRRRRSLAAIAAGAALALLDARCVAASTEPLVFCLAEDSAPYSTLEAGVGKGLDHDLAAAVAARLGRPFRAVWFESRYDKDGNLGLDARALLAAHVCDVVMGLPLYGPQQEELAATRARTPDYQGAKPLRLRPYEALVPVSASRPYRASALVLVASRTEDSQVASLAATGGRPVAVIAGTMASMALATSRNGEGARNIRGYNTRQDVLGPVAEGEVDFALVDVAVWDRFRVAHPGSPLRTTRFDYPIHINIGSLMRTADVELREAVDAALEEQLEGREVLALATKAGATYIAPREPQMRAALGLQDFIAAGRE